MILPEWVRERINSIAFRPNVLTSWVTVTATYKWYFIFFIPSSSMALHVCVHCSQHAIHMQLAVSINDSSSLRKSTHTHTHTNTIVVWKLSSSVQAINFVSCPRVATNCFQRIQIVIAFDHQLVTTRLLAYDKSDDNLSTSSLKLMIPYRTRDAYKNKTKATALASSWDYTKLWLVGHHQIISEHWV